MVLSVVSIFPGIIENFIQYGLLAKAIEKKILTLDLYDLRDFAANKHRKVDDRPFGGGAGMVMMPQPLFDAIEFIKQKRPGKVILFSAYGELLTQKKVKELAKEDHLILICGRYEGVDQRVIDTLVDEEISVGNYVLMGGETAAQVVIESVARMLKGVVGKPESVETDSFYEENQFAFPQYTQPREYKGLVVPDVLLSGHHKDIIEWRKKHQKRRRT
ncbi:MAG: tRNA (guanosine(37)-N1)-methyltransferase TrmD [Candidatus Aminicenantes bacterium]|nr:tRNA (guanosine(37)-N1)-methyltransferase TrmD [Candidatus Aminicenantes bacterium]NIM84953.1 tRNA (guanosine(37)-N1)-methyltransferase TrmD [Candidatus Aminicenantes bacterium]NIN24467.1 tRNA (guanosine(37)-N1)-methyltransferase TrmD [Candidatus Aminicenantes bacterium]NIN48231.1 tRNA (guanosine(37)-N1)-methyltransferase TrmD [Candidatus Aminicenantes bacterium]NIN91134.1 tRNA (guanosine(37)-N1)-methyltransferase TrmD [Candidatus Aminicenantes bacterium]